VGRSVHFRWNGFSNDAIGAIDVIRPRGVRTLAKKTILEKVPLRRHDVVRADDPVGAA